MPYTINWQLMGIALSGDIGDLTIYTDRFGRKIAFPKSPPKKPPSARQEVLRARFRTAQGNYMALSDAQKTDYENVTKRTSLGITGQNLWISISLKHTFDILRTVERQSGITLVQPTAV